MPHRRDVRDTYDRIGAHFARTRPEPWEEVTEFLDGRSGAVGLDIGAGNGRHAEPLASHVELVLALDASLAPLREAVERGRDRGFDLATALGDATALPVGDGCIDLAVYIATIHHLPSRAERIGSLDELARVLSGRGAGLVSAWSVSHDRFDRESGFDAEVDWTLPDGETVPRFYHVYDLDEFRGEIRDSELRAETLFESHGNCYAVVSAEG